MTKTENTLRIATRESRLALWQAQYVATQLRETHPGLHVELVPMTTQGDQILDRSLAEVGGKGLFIKELERAIDAGRADIAVHSMKDVPTDLPEGMTLAAMLPRADPRDAFVSNRFATFESLPQGARVGTSSPRRQCQIRFLRPDLQLSSLRGNVETRLRKLDANEHDAIILASAGLTRLELAHRITQHLPFEVSLPAAGQGVIGIECRASDSRSIELVRALNDDTGWHCCVAERAFARRLQGNCFSPIGAFARLEAGALHLQGAVGSMDGKTLFRDSIVGPYEQAEVLGVELAERVLAAGARALLDEQREREAQLQAQQQTQQ
jgi:hydroxymethylbilane synthase